MADICPDIPCTEFDVLALSLLDCSHSVRWTLMSFENYCT